MTAVAVRDSVVLRGYVTRPENIPRIMDIAKEFYPNVINQMEVGGDQEVELKVRVIEIDRTKLRELGFNFLGTTNFAFLGSLPGGLAPLSSLTNPIGAASVPGHRIRQNFAANPSLLGGVVNNNHTFSDVSRRLAVRVAAENPRQPRAGDDQRPAGQHAVRR